MTQEQNVTNRNAIIVFNKTVKASEIAYLGNKSQCDVVIHKDLVIDKDFYVDGNLYVMGDVKAVKCNKIDVTGDFYCWGRIDAYDIYVKGYFYCDALMDVTDIVVGENFFCDDSIVAHNSVIFVAGDFECPSIKATEIYVLGRMRVKEDIIANIIEIGY